MTTNSSNIFASNACGEQLQTGDPVKSPVQDQLRMNTTADLTHLINYRYRHFHNLPPGKSKSHIHTM